MQKRRWLVVVVVCLSLFIALAAYKFFQISAMIAMGKSFPEPSASVEWEKVAVQQVSSTYSALGEVVPTQSLDVHNEIEGIISKVGFTSGGQVKKGQILVQLDSSDELAQLQSAQAEADLAKLSLQRYQSLLTSNASSKNDYDQAVAQNSMALAQIKVLQLRIAKKSIVAPFAAKAGLHQLQVGQFLPTNTNITHLVGAGNSWWVDFELPQHQANISIGTAVQINAEEVLATPLTGKIIASDASLSTSSRNLRFRALVVDDKHQLQPGVAVNVHINLPAKTALLVSPMSVRYEPAGSFVYVITTTAAKDENKNAAIETRASKRLVLTGAEHLNKVIIKEGLKEGEIIAVNGSYKITDGMLIKLHADAVDTGK